jgi:hypothetical protein
VDARRRGNRGAGDVREMQNLIKAGRKNWVTGSRLFTSNLTVNASALKHQRLKH